MSQSGSPATIAGGRLVNPPSLATVAAAYVKGVVMTAVGAAVLLLLFRGLNGFSLSGYLPLIALLSGLWLLIIAVSSLFEPVLLITPDAISISSWGARLFRNNTWRSYPMQPLNPEWRRGGRGGSYIRMYLRDSTGYPRRVLFHFVGLDDLQAALMQAGCTVS